MVIANFEKSFETYLIFKKSKKLINEMKDIKDGIDSLIKNIDLEYKTLKKEFNSIF